MLTRHRQESVSMHIVPKPDDIQKVLRKHKLRKIKEQNNILKKETGMEELIFIFYDHLPEIEYARFYKTM